jgi:hypothetical protein
LIRCKYCSERARKTKASPDLAIKVSGSPETRKVSEAVEI